MDCIGAWFLRVFWVIKLKLWMRIAALRRRSGSSLKESESEYISGNDSSTKVKVCLHNVSGNISIFVGSMKWGRFDWFLHAKDLWIRIAALNPSIELWIESESEYISGDVSSTKVKVCLYNISGNISICVESMKWGILDQDTINKY